MTWGDTHIYCGVCGLVCDLQNVQRVQASQALSSYSSSAFAAVRADGSVVSWGSSLFECNSSAIDSIQQASDRAFAAILADGSVVTWGDAKFGGDSSAVREHLKNFLLVEDHDNLYPWIPDEEQFKRWVVQDPSASPPCTSNMSPQQSHSASPVLWKQSQT